MDLLFVCLILRRAHSLVRLFVRRRARVDQRAGDPLGGVHRTEGVQRQPAGERRARSARGSRRDLRLQQPGAHPADPHAEHAGKHNIEKAGSENLHNLI